MVTKKEVLSSIRDEIKIIKHLASKIKYNQLKYKPNKKQRTMLELLQYLSYCGLVGTSFTVTGNWDAYKHYYSKFLFLFQLKVYQYFYPL